MYKIQLPDFQVFTFNVFMRNEREPERPVIF
jgi:hypothetical protein